MPYLVIPPVRTCTNLDTIFKVIGPAKEVAAKFCEILGCGIIETDHE